MDAPRTPDRPLAQPTSWRTRLTRFGIVGIATIIFCSLFLHIDLAAPLNAAFHKLVPFGSTPMPQGTPAIGQPFPSASPDSSDANSQLSAAVSQMGSVTPAPQGTPAAPALPSAAQHAGLITKPNALADFQDAQRSIARAQQIGNSGTPGDPGLPGFGPGGLSDPPSGGLTPPQQSFQPTPEPTPMNVPIIQTPAPTNSAAPVVAESGQPALFGVTPGQQSGQSPESLSGLMTAQDAAFVQDNGGQQPSAYTTQVVSAARSQDEIWPTDPIQCTLQSSVQSDLPGTAVAVVSRDVYSHLWPHAVLIPALTEIWGSYNAVVGQGQTRMQFRWDMLVYPNGATLPLTSVQAMDPQGLAGLPADVNNHIGKVLTTTLLATAVGAVSGITAARASTTVSGGSFPQLLGISTGNQIQNMATQAAAAAQAIPPTLLVHGGTQFSIRFAAIQTLPSWQEIEAHYGPPHEQGEQ